MFLNLRRKLLLLLVLPVALAMVVAGLVGLLMAREVLLDRWREAALLSLESAAHGVDMRLGRVKDLVQLLGAAGEGTEEGANADWLLERLKAEPGVLRANITWKDAPQAEPAPFTGGRGMGRGGGMGQGGPMRGRRFHMVRVERVGLPSLDAQAGQRAVSLSFGLVDDQGQEVGRLSAVVAFSHLMAGVERQDWWKSDQAFLVALNGRVLAGGGGANPRLPGPPGDPFTAEIIHTLEQKPAGTLFGPGRPPEEVAGFYRLRQAPWALLLISPGRQVLAPIIRFRDLFLLSGAVSILVIGVLIWLVGGRLVAAVRRVSQAARGVAQGRYGEPLPPAGRDEVGSLVESFNAMLAGLKERDLIYNTFGRYVDPGVAKRLLAGGEATRLGGRRRQVAVLMSDVRGFTPLLESLSPEESIVLVNRLLTPLINQVQATGGIIVDFLGDAVLAFYDTLDRDETEAAALAVTCALGMQEAARAFNRDDRPAGVPEVGIGVGVHFGEVVVGNIGSEARTKYGIVGAAVNYTQRLESAAEAGQVVASAALGRVLGDRLEVAERFTAELKGVQGSQDLILVAGMKEDHRVQ